MLMLLHGIMLLAALGSVTTRNLDTVNLHSVEDAQDSPLNAQDPPPDDSSGDMSRIICYFPNWARYKGFKVEHIDPSLCTHIHIAFVYIEGTHLVPTDQYDFQTYQELRLLKLQNPSLKLLLTVGGYDMGSQPFIYVTSNPVLLAQFANNVVQYCREHSMDGVDVDWEYPAPQYKQRHVTLLKVLREKFDEQAATGPLTLAVSLSAGVDKIENSYNINGFQRHIDFANLMTYDMHGYWGRKQPETGLHSALRKRHGNDKQAQEWVVSRYIQKGLPRSKLVLGIPTYGRSFRLCDPSQPFVGAVACGPGDEGHWTVTPGVLAYYEICLKQDYDSWIIQYDQVQEAPYSYKGVQWVGYDNAYSVSKKLEYAHGLSLGGVMYWDLAKDEYANQCGGGNYPLIRLAKLWLENPPSPTETPRPTTITTSTASPITTTTRRTTTRRTTTRRTTTPRPTTSTTTTPSGVIECTFDGEYIRDPNDCGVFYHCVNGQPMFQRCPHGLFFDTVTNVCNWPDDVDCAIISGH